MHENMQKAGKENIVKYLKAKVDEMKAQVIKLLNNISELKSENKNLTKEVNTLRRVNEKLTYQNELRAKALKQDRTDMFNLVKLASTGKIEEIKEKYDKNNNKEYVL